MKVALGASALGLLTVFTLVGSAAPPEKVSPKAARGKYPVENVGLCQDCHTPRNERGEYVREKWLQGSELFFKPLAPIPGWTTKSPAIAGLPNWTDEQAQKFFTTGIAPDGSHANPPMPEFRFSREDANAVIVYLRSLKSK